MVLTRREPKAPADAPLRRLRRALSATVLVWWAAAALIIGGTRIFREMISRPWTARADALGLSYAERVERGLGPYADGYRLVRDHTGPDASVGVQLPEFPGDAGAALRFNELLWPRNIQVAFGEPDERQLSGLRRLASSGRPVFGTRLRAGAAPGPVPFARLVARAGDTELWQFTGD